MEVYQGMGGWWDESGLFALSCDTGFGFHHLEFWFVSALR
jgi:hypothetical protein